jgi:hypothetical protein
MLPPRAPVPGRADGYPSGPPTDPYVRHARIRFLRQSGCCPRQDPPGSAVPWLAVVRVGALSVSPLSPASGCAARRRLPSRGSLGPHVPTFRGTLRRDDCPPARLGGLRVSRVPRYPARFPRAWSPKRARGPVEAPSHARALGPPVPHAGTVTRRPVALPRSRVTPMATCPALRPRWCPAPSPSRVQDCCRPAQATRRLSPRYDLEGYPPDHDSTHFGAPSRGLHPRSLPLRTAPDGEARGCHS